MTRPAAFASAHPNDLKFRRLSLGWVILWACGCAAGFAAMLGGAAAADLQIGAAARVVHTVTGVVTPTRPPEVLRAGIDVFQNETIKTGPDSAAQLIFQDKTELSIGANSEVILDRFVFDPDPAKSAVAVSIVTGVARFTTGLLPKTAYTIRTPTATMSVRGTTLTITVGAPPQTVPQAGPGQTLSGRGGNCTLLTVTAVGSGTMVPGGTLSGTGIATGTKIVSQVSGARGGIGTYSVSPPQTVASTAITETGGVRTATAVGSIGATELDCGNCPDPLARSTEVDVENGVALLSAEGQTVSIDAGQTSVVQCGGPPSAPFASPPVSSAAAQMNALLEQDNFQAATQSSSTLPPAIPGVSGATTNGNPTMSNSHMP